MALDKPGLEADLEQLFSSPPATIALCAQAWADAMEAYSSDIVPASTAVASAAAALKTALETAFGTEAAAPGMETAFAAFATSVGAGMAGWTPTPPPGPVGFAAQFATLPFPETHAEAAAAFATLIDDWMKTGTAALVAPPNTVVTWG